jgi:pimeloyl-ACP methyl ester carboxylesterase
MDALASVLSGASVEVIAGAGHAVPSENPTGFNAAVLRFLHGLDPG